MNSNKPTDNRAWEMAREFLLRQRHMAPDGPTHLSEEVVLLRQRLILEELGELAIAIHQQDRVEVADACCDLAYVLHGTAVAMGCPTLSYFEGRAPQYRTDLLIETAKACVRVVETCRTTDDWTVEVINAALQSVSRLAAFYSIPFEACFKEVHASNMSKDAPSEYKPGEKYGSKTAKGEGYRAPQLKEILDTKGAW